MVAAASAQKTSPAALIKLAAKSSAAAPKLDSNMEMADRPGNGQAPDEEHQQQPEQREEDDIMQLARLGDIPAMEKLFESKGYDATYADDEGITPLHVRCASDQPAFGIIANM